MPSPRHAPRLPRPFSLLLTAFASANVADGVRGVALPLLAVELTRDPLLVASLGMAQSLPQLIAGLPAGVLVDRLDRRRLLAVTNGVEGALFALVVAGVLLDQLTLPLLYLAALALGTNETVRDTTASAAVPALVPTAQLEAGNGRIVTVEFVANQLAGPALGASLFAAAAALPFALSAGLAAGAAALVIRLPPLNRAGRAHAPREPQAAPRRLGVALRQAALGLWRDVAAGAGFLAHHRLLRTVAVLAVVLTMTDAAWFSILVLLVTDVLGLPSAAYGVILAIAAVGGAGGGLVASRVIRRWGAAAVLRGGLLLIGAAQVAIGLSGSAVVVTAALAVGNVVFAVWLTAAASLRHALTPDRLLGRVTGAWRTAAVGAIPVGFLIGGLVADAWGIRAPFLLGAPLVLAAALVSRPLTAAAIAIARADASGDGYPGGAGNGVTS